MLEFAEQFAYIGVAEEVFYRGYLMGRFGEWLGNCSGLIINGIIFGLTHVISLMSIHGLDRPFGDAIVGLGTFIGGLIMGYVYLRSGSILPGAIVHTSINAYMLRLFHMLA